MMDVFSGVLTGSAFAGHVTNPYDPSRPADVGHFLIAIKPDLFMSLEDFKQRMDYLYQRVVGSDKMAGIDRIYFPGEIEQLTQEERLQSGIPYVEAEIDALNKEAEMVGADRIVVISDHAEKPAENTAPTKDIGAIRQLLSRYKCITGAWERVHMENYWETPLVKFNQCIQGTEPAYS
ncbi:hypothetical protein LTR28_005622 [Elasticomyces elasticus]|nr:hypothetical protein LTR28_005622 [Elasticomyces elasticus]